MSRSFKAGFNTKIESGDSMQSIFLEGLKTAREIMLKEGIAQLDVLIAEHESGAIETTAIKIKAETR